MFKKKKNALHGRTFYARNTASKQRFSKSGKNHSGVILFTKSLPHWKIEATHLWLSKNTEATSSLKGDDDRKAKLMSLLLRLLI